VAYERFRKDEVKLFLRKAGDKNSPTKATWKLSEEVR